MKQHTVFPPEENYSPQSHRDHRGFICFAHRETPMGKTQAALKGRMAEYLMLSAPHDNDGIRLRRRKEMYPEAQHLSVSLNIDH